MIDPAMVRPGRLDKLLYVDLPTPSERVEILRTMTKKTPLASDADRELESFATSERCEGFSGADLAALVREAATLALRSKLESVGAFEVDDGVLQFEGTGVGGPLAEEEAQAGEAEEPILVSSSHFREAMMKVSPSVSLAQRKKYAVLNKKFSGVPTKGGKKEEGLGEPAGAGAGSTAGGLDAEPEESGGPME
jgi:ribosome biogenesis ATPase